MKYTSKGPFEKGYNKMVSAVDNPEMMGMEFGVVKMNAGDIMHFDYAQEVVSMGSAAAFMITGPATKIINLGAVKIVLGAKRFALYLLFTILFALLTGWIVNMRM